jgi:hypothetical protein
MKKSVRIAIELLVPACVFALVTPVYHAVLDFGRFRATDLPLLVGVVFVLALVPSGIFTLVRESWIAAGFTRKKDDRRLACVLGAVVGTSFLLLVGDSEIWTRSTSDYFFVTILSGAIAFLVAHSTRHPEEHNQSPQQQRP